MSATITLATIDYASDYSDYAPARLVRVGVAASPAPAAPLPLPRVRDPVAPGPVARWHMAKIGRYTPAHGLFLFYRVQVLVKQERPV